MTSFWEILKSSKNLKASDAFAELWGKSIADSWDIITITGNLPLTFETKGEALKNYHLYGTENGAGVETENLFDVSDFISNYVAGYGRDGNGEVIASSGGHSGYSTYAIPVIQNQIYYLRGITRPSPTSAGGFRLYFLDSNFGWISRTEPISQYNATSVYKFTTPANTSYLQIQTPVAIAIPDMRLMITSIAPTSYIPHGYKIPILNTSGEHTNNIYDSSATDTSKGYVVNSYLNSDGTIGVSSSWRISEFIEVIGGVEYDIKWINATSTSPSYVFYNKDKQYISGYAYGSASSALASAPLNAKYLRISVYSGYLTSTEILAPSVSNYDLFIGDSKLGAEEYVDYGEQKIYKRTEQSLLPYNMDSGASEKTKYISTVGTIRISTIKNNYVCGYINVLPSTAYALKDFSGNTTAICYYDSNKNYISGEAYNNRGSFIVTTPANCQYVRMTAQDRDPNTNVFVKGNEIPETYIPYLQPTDPPAPLPAIQAYQGENTLSSEETVGEVSVTGKIKEI